MSELWKIYRDYQYKVSNTGRIININSGVEKMKSIDTYGYEVTTFFKEGKRKQFKVHRLVAKLFVEGYSDDLVVNHKDGVKTNNHHQNLEWVTPLENTNHAISNDLFNNELTREQVREIRQRVVRRCKVNGIMPLAKEYGVHVATISRIVNHKNWIEGTTINK